MAEDCRSWPGLRQPQQIVSPSGATRHENYRESVRRSIEYLRRTSQLGPENGSAAFLSWKRMHSSTIAAAADRYAAKRPIVAQLQQDREPVAGGRLHHERRYNHGDVDDVDKQADVEQQQQQQQPLSKRHQYNRGRLLLIIDVQSRRGAVEEVSCHEGDNCFDLARGFITRRVQPVVVDQPYTAVCTR